MITAVYSEVITSSLALRYTSQNDRARAEECRTRNVGREIWDVEREERGGERHEQVGTWIVVGLRIVRTSKGVPTYRKIKGLTFGK